MDVGSRKVSLSIHLQTPQNRLTQPLPSFHHNSQARCFFPQSTKLKKKERARALLSPYLPIRSIRARPFKCKNIHYSSENPRSRGTAFCWPFSAACVAFARFWLETELASASQPFKDRWNYRIFLLGNKCFFQISIKNLNMLRLIIFQCCFEIVSILFQYV